MRQIFLLITIGFYLQNCYYPPRPVIRLEAGQEVIWNAGRQILHAADSSFSIALMYEKVDSDQYRFQVEIANHDRQTVLISPENFYYTYKSSETVRVPATDPESEILELEKKYSRDYASYQTNSGNNSLLALFNVVALVATIGEEQTEEEELQTEINNLKVENADLENELELNKNQTQYMNGLTFWEQKALRRTTLPPGTSVSGLVFFPVKLRSSHLPLQFHICIEKKIYTFNFEQISHQSTSARY